MYLSNILIFNYSCCKCLDLEFQKDDPTVLIGINDSGKSTILGAIGLLLNQGPDFNYSDSTSAKSDLSNTTVPKTEYESQLALKGLPIIPYTEKETIIIGKFVFADEEMNSNIQEKLSNHLLWALEKSEDNSIWIAKIFDANSQMHQDYLLAWDKDVSSDCPNELWATKTNDLTKIRKTLGVLDADVENVNNAGRFSNLEQIRAIYSRYQCHPSWTKYKFKDDVEYFPVYRYLDWNCSLDDLKSIANDALKSRIDPHLGPLKEMASGLSTAAESDINYELKTITTWLKTDIPNLAAIKTKVHFDVKTIISDIFINKLNSDGDIHLDLQGEGIKRQLWFALIKYASFKAREGSEGSIKKFIWCFDEPETHLYPGAQRGFYDNIKTLSSNTVQAIISTHSTVFVDRSCLTTIKRVQLDGGYTRLANCHNIEDVFSSLQLKNSDFLFYDKFLIVEGDTEEVLIPHLFNLYTGKTLQGQNIQLIKLGGKDKRQENLNILIRVLGDFKKLDGCAFTLLDHDAKFNDVKGPDNVVYLGRQDIEDLFQSKTWVSFIEQVAPYAQITTEEIDSIITRIPCDQEIQREQKFYPRLKAHLLNKITEPQKALLWQQYPAKGRKQGEILKNSITQIEHIPQEIKNVFDDIMKEG
jgi:putative ATP-dependent endonuclease of the OLD family